MRKLRLLAAGDTAPFGRALHAALAAEPRLELLGEARQIGQALEMARSFSPDLLLMDMLFAGRGGFAATADIMEREPSRILLLASEGKDPSPELRAKAVLAGAMDIFSKPPHGRGADLGRWGSAAAALALRIAESPPRARALAGRVLEIFALVTSTGGPSVLSTILGGYRGGFAPLPVLVIQHVAEGFTPGLCRWLEASTGLQVETARDGAEALNGHVYLAPEGRDLELGPAGLLRTPQPEMSFGPSGDRLLRSLARHCGPRAGAAVLTGMGRDGAEGLLSLARAGGLTMVQEESSCTVSGMPVAALSLCGGHASLCLSAIQAVIHEASRPAFAHHHA